MSKSWHHLPISKHQTTGVVNTTLYPYVGSILLPPDFGTPTNPDGSYHDDGVSTRMDYITNGMKQLVDQFDAVVDSKMSKNGYQLKIQTQNELFLMIQLSRHICEEFPDDLIYADFFRRGGSIMGVIGLFDQIQGTYGSPNPSLKEEETVGTTTSLTCEETTSLSDSEGVGPPIVAWE